MRPFERLDEGEKQIVRYQAKQFMKHCRLFHAEIIPNIPNDEDDEGEIIPRKPATMQQQEEGFGYNERECKAPGPVAEPKPTKRGVSRRWTSNISKAQAPKVIGAADIEPKRRPEIRGR
jgi:hypothetical protein